MGGEEAMCVECRALLAGENDGPVRCGDCEGRRLARLALRRDAMVRMRDGNDAGSSWRGEPVGEYARRFTGVVPFPPRVTFGVDFWVSCGIIAGAIVMTCW